MVEAQVRQMQTVTVQMQSLKTALAGIPSQLVVENPVLPEEQLPQLKLWLAQNDCLATGVDFQTCYAQTRLKLITAVYNLDNSNDLKYASQVEINQLMTTTNGVIDALTGTGTLLKAKK